MDGRSARLTHEYHHLPALIHRTPLIGRRSCPSRQREGFCAASAVARRAERADDGRNEPYGLEVGGRMSSRCVRLSAFRPSGIVFCGIKIALLGYWN
jgi:hypothetical protein